MKKQTIIATLTIFVLGFLFLLPSKAYADPPKCFVNKGTNTGPSGEGINYTQNDCTSTTDTTGTPLANDKCYEINTNLTPEPIDCVKIVLHLAAFQKNGGQTDQQQNAQSAIKYEAYSDVKSSPLWGYLQPALNIFSTGVLILVVAAISFSGIQYAASQDNPQMAGDAKKRISYALVALAIYAFFFAILQWLIPGGIFG